MHACMCTHADNYLYIFGGLESVTTYICKKCLALNCPSNSVQIHIHTHIHAYIHTNTQADNYLYIFRGLESATTYAKNVWRSADGVSWSVSTANVYSPSRDTKDALALSVRGKIYLFGGVYML